MRGGAAVPQRRSLDRRVAVIEDYMDDDEVCVVVRDLQEQLTLRAECHPAQGADSEHHKRKRERAPKYIAIRPNPH